MNDCHCGSSHSPVSPASSSQNSHSCHCRDHCHKMRHLDPSTPQTVQDAANSCIEFVKKSLNFELDFSTNTLPVVDYYLQQGADTASQSPETAQLVATVVGCYFGQIIHNMFPLQWNISSEKTEHWSLYTCTRSLIVFPIRIALIALQGPKIEQDLPPLELVSSLQQQLAQRLSSLPDVREQEYIALSTRIEVLEIAFDLLSAGTC